MKHLCLRIAAKYRRKIKPVYLAIYPFLYRLYFYYLLWKTEFGNSDSNKTKLWFSSDQCFAFDNGKEDQKCKKVLSNYLSNQYNSIALYGTGKLCNYLLENNPNLKKNVDYIVDNETEEKSILGIPVVTLEDIPSNIDALFICKTKCEPLNEVKKKLPSGVPYITLDILPNINRWIIPKRAWSVFPVEIEDFKIHQNLDMVLMDLPCRYFPMMPNGLGYVHNILKAAGIKFQTIDYNILIYHQYHSRRLLNGTRKIFTSGGYEIKGDPWDNTNTEEWSKPDFIEFFKPEIEKIATDIIQAKPKILGLSLNVLNTLIAKEIVKRVRQYYPDMIVIVGGYLSAHYYLGKDVATRLFPEADYVFVGEADLTLLPLLEELLKGNKPYDLPGIISKYDSKDRVWQAAPLLQNPDSVDFPMYDWVNPKIYKSPTMAFPLCL